MYITVSISEAVQRKGANNAKEATQYSGDSACIPPLQQDVDLVDQEQKKSEKATPLTLPGIK